MPISVSDADVERALASLRKGQRATPQGIIEGAATHYADAIAKGMPEDVGFALIVKGKGADAYRLVSTLDKDDLKRVLKRAREQVITKMSGLILPG